MQFADTHTENTETASSVREPTLCQPFKYETYGTITVDVSYASVFMGSCLDDPLAGGTPPPGGAVTAEEVT